MAICRKGYLALKVSKLTTSKLLEGCSASTFHFLLRDDDLQHQNLNFIVLLTFINSLPDYLFQTTPFDDNIRFQSKLLSYL